MKKKLDIDFDMAENEDDKLDDAFKEVGSLYTLPRLILRRSRRRVSDLHHQTQKRVLVTHKGKTSFEIHLNTLCKRPFTKKNNHMKIQVK